VLRLLAIEFKVMLVARVTEMVLCDYFAVMQVEYKLLRLELEIMKALQISHAVSMIHVLQSVIMKL
jgi:hypothetical protein